MTTTDTTTEAAAELETPRDVAGVAAMIHARRENLRDNAGRVELKARDAAHEAAKAIGVDNATADAIIKPLIRQLRDYDHTNEYLRNGHPPVSGAAATLQAALDHLMETDPSRVRGLGISAHHTVLYDRDGHKITVASLRALLIERYELLKLLGAVVDPLPCQHEYAGGCAVHGYFVGEDQSVRCAHGEARDVLAAAGLYGGDDTSPATEA
jgi:hypothetical protein